MPIERALARARRDRRESKSVSTPADEFVREDIDRIRDGARSPAQAIATGLSQAESAGVDVPAVKGGAKRAAAKSSGSKALTVPRRSRATPQAPARESTHAALPGALSEHAREAVAARSTDVRSVAARKAARTQGPTARKAAARKAARNRAPARAAGAARAARTRAMRSRSR